NTALLATSGVACAGSRTVTRSIPEVGAPSPEDGKTNFLCGVDLDRDPRVVGRALSETLPAVGEATAAAATDCAEGSAQRADDDGCSDRETGISGDARGCSCG